jgi:hypothetical protein
LPQFGTFTGRSVYFPRFGILNKEKSGNPGAYPTKSYKYCFTDNNNEIHTNICSLNLLHIYNLNRLHICNHHLLHICIFYKFFSRTSC